MTVPNRMFQPWAKLHSNIAQGAKITTGSMAVVDGMNLSFEGLSTPSLQQLLEQLTHLVTKFDHVFVVLDRSMRPRLNASEHQLFDQVVANGYQGAVFTQVAQGQSADRFILKEARSNGAIVVSNDSFREWQEEFPWILESDRILGATKGWSDWDFDYRTPRRAD